MNDIMFIATNLSLPGEQFVLAVLAVRLRRLSSSACLFSLYGLSSSWRLLMQSERQRRIVAVGSILEEHAIQCSMSSLPELFFPCIADGEEAIRPLNQAGLNQAGVLPF